MGLLLATLAAFACNALTGVDDLGTADDADAGDSAPPSRLDDSGLDVADAVTVVDASVPSYCRGLRFYARLDGTFTSAEGIAADSPPDASFTTGRFGKAATILGEAGTVFYPTSAAVYYPQAEGTVAIWFKPTWSTAQVALRSYFKPSLDKVFSATNNAGPQVLDLGTSKGMGATNFNADASSTEAILPCASWKAGWNELGWNHLVTSWRRSPSLLSFTLNGGRTYGGVDGGGDAAAMHAETTSYWDPQVPEAGILRFASAGNPVDGSLDELAVWNRVLPPDEVQALYASSVSIGDACKR